MRLKNKTALITGGNSGIGLATAKLFVAEGARVAITGRNQATLEAAAKELGPNALAIVADATDIAATEKAIEQAVAKFGKLDIVFANAGIPGNTPVGGTTLAAFENVIRTNITSVFFTVQAAVPHLNDGASIVLNGSVISVGSTWFRPAPLARRSGMALRPPPKHSLPWTSEFPGPSRSDVSARPRKLRRRCCSSLPTMLPTSRPRRSLSMAARRVRPRARRSIARNCALWSHCPPRSRDRGGRHHVCC